MNYLKPETDALHQPLPHWSIDTALRFVDEEMARLVASDPSFQPTLPRRSRKAAVEATHARQGLPSPISTRA